jgi:recombinational DNA repair protein RecR
LLSPLIAIILVLILENKAHATLAKLELEKMKDTHVKCPDCAELVKKEARVCKHCSCKLIPQ